MRRAAGRIMLGSIALMVLSVGGCMIGLHFEAPTLPPDPSDHPGFPTSIVAGLAFLLAGGIGLIIGFALLVFDDLWGRWRGR